VLNVPLGETLAARVAAIAEIPASPLKAEPEGRRYATDIFDGGVAVRAGLRWQPSEALTIDLRGVRAHNNSHGGIWALLAAIRPTPPSRARCSGTALRTTPAQHRSARIRFASAWTEASRIGA
jgi:hypothetical protein